MKTVRQAFLAAILAFWSACLLAQSMEIIELRSRTVDEVLPTLLPLVEPGGTLTGMNNQLFLKASPRNRADIKRALAAIDTPSRRLIIRVAQNRQSDARSSGAEANGQVVLGSTRRADVGARVWDTQSLRGEAAAQMVQTVDGGRAFIRIGRTLALPMRQIAIGPGGAVVGESMVYRDVGSGFYAVPHVNGERVSIEISQQAESIEAYPRGAIASQRLSTSVSGRLGEWIELGGSGHQAVVDQSGSRSIGTGDARDQRTIWLKVDAVE